MGQHGKYGALVAGLLALAGPAEAGCRLALALALDISTSVDEAEYVLQRNGLAAALISDEVRALLLAGDEPVAIAVYEWSGHRHQTVQLGWTMLDSAEAVTRASESILGFERSDNAFPTGLGEALGFGATLMRRGPDCARRVIDVSGDGVHNDGYQPMHAYRHFPFENITVNGLVVLGADAEVAWYYRNEVIRGPGAFVETAEGYEDFERAMVRKLVREIGTLVIGDAEPER